MSFILDALKKSEAERQRQAGPTLLELRITRPQRRYPLWSLVVGVLLAANIAVLGVFGLHRPPAASPAAIAPSAAIVPVPAPTSPLPAAATAASPQAAAARAAGPAASTAAVTSVAPLAPTPPSELSDASPQTRNPADYEPAVSTATAPQSPATASPQGAVDYASLPSSNQISGDIPALQLDLLVYSELVSERYALINMHRVREGDVLPDGARVLAITPNGVAMDYRGQDFLLRSGGTAQ